MVKRAMCISLLLSALIAGTDSSVIFLGGTCPSTCDGARRSLDRRKRRVPNHQQWGKSCQVRERRSGISKLSATSTHMHLAFTPVQAGKFLSLAAVVGYLAKQLRSESFSRAIYFWFHAGPVVAHYKFTRWYLEKTKAPLEKRDLVYNSLHDKYCIPCLDIALHLKGLYVKIAQIVSSRPDFVPPQYIELFTSVQDSIPQSSIEEVVEIVNENLQSEFGKNFDEVFESIDPIALGSASIGQCHLARLRDARSIDPDWSHGEEVAVKVMHRGAEERFHHDFQVFRLLCKVALSGWETILDECYRQIMTEFDYRKEAESLQVVRSHLMKSSYNTLVTVPEPCPKLCSKELLVMEMLHGKKLSDTMEDDLAAALGGSRKDADELIKRKRLELILGKEKMESLGYPLSNDFEKTIHNLGVRGKLRLLKLYRKAQKYVNLLVDVQGHQMLSLGIFNGDPHPGNLLVLTDGKLGLIDFGQTKRITDEERLGVARVVDAIGHHSSDMQIADYMRQLGFRTKFNKDDTLSQYGTLFFDSDIDGKLMGCATPQIYFSRLNKIDPLVNVPDVAIFVARSSFIIRGMGTVLGQQIRTSARWKEQAKITLAGEKKLSKL